MLANKYVNYLRLTSKAQVKMWRAQESQGPSGSDRSTRGEGTDCTENFYTLNFNQRLKKKKALRDELIYMSYFFPWSIKTSSKSSRLILTFFNPYTSGISDLLHLKYYPFSSWIKQEHQIKWKSIPNEENAQVKHISGLKPDNVFLSFPRRCNKYLRQRQ